MQIIYGLLVASILTNFTLMAQENKIYKVHTVTFYNLENLFDTEDDPLTFDNDRTPLGKDHWTAEVYNAKLNNMAQVISQIGKEFTGNPPTLIGVCEIENRKVLEDLLNQDWLAATDYGIVHFDSPDRRGIDVALLYQKKMFTPSHYYAYELKIYDNNDLTKRVFTRDQLIVSGYLDGEKIHLIINHWPSRRGGEARSRYKRIKAAKLNEHIIDSIFSEDPYAKIITMGDLNDDPTSPSVKVILETEKSKDNLSIGKLYNPMEALYKKGIGSLAWRDGWNLFDQMIISSELTKKDYSSYRFYTAGVFNKNYLTTTRGKYKGYPFRSFANGAFTGGYSDHFPVYLYLIKEVDKSN
ncbi:MAG: endonuclease/exonuclease/phosphatase family protein [Flavobacteriaceae bacterium]|nr:endonuclease/exonuclease/phosphatase family protein [Flavobacteriaceae bacterium]